MITCYILVNNFCFSFLCFFLGEVTLELDFYLTISALYLNIGAINHFYELSALQHEPKAFVILQ